MAMRVLVLVFEIKFAYFSIDNMHEKKMKKVDDYMTYIRVIKFATPFIVLYSCRVRSIGTTLISRPAVFRLRVQHTRAPVFMEFLQCYAICNLKTQVTQSIHTLSASLRLDRRTRISTLG